MSDDGPAPPERRDDPATPEGRSTRPDGEAGADLRRRVAAQFSDGERADVWRGLARLLPTYAYLNLGYSPRGLPHVVGSSQRRLAAHLAAGLAWRLPATTGRLLDLGCGRGGPARVFAGEGYSVTGLDLVPYNLALARETVARAGTGSAGTGTGADGVDAGFVAGDATKLPFAADAFVAAAAVDSLVYVPEKRRAFAEVGRVVEAGGVLALSDLVAESPDRRARERLDAFADAWDTAPVLDRDAYRRRLRAADLAVEAVEDVTSHSVGRFRKWSTLFLALAKGPTAAPLASALRRWGADPDAVVERVRRAHEALPSLRHVVVYARVPAAHGIPRDRRTGREIRRGRRTTRGTPRGRRGSARSP